MSNYNYITINNYFMPKSEDGVQFLSTPSPKKWQDLRDHFKSLPIAALTCATVTIGNKKILQKGFYEQVSEIEKSLRKYKASIGKKTKYLGFMEATKHGNAHLHMIIYNGYQNPFIKSFQRLGRHNRNDKSFMPVKNTEKYLEYITKEHTEANKYYHNFD